MLAIAFLTIATATERACPPPPGQIPLTRNEIAALFGALVIEPARGARHRLRWSAWRRRHQHRARASITSGKPGNHEDQGPGRGAPRAGVRRAWLTAWRVQARFHPAAAIVARVVVSRPPVRRGLA